MSSLTLTHMVSMFIWYWGGCTYNGLGRSLGDIQMSITLLVEVEWATIYAKKTTNLTLWPTIFGMR
ncbi:MAG: hypothetical protein MJK10_20275 [Pseudomonadales bacterium]|nr:hypothetical protein [Pseudomonadales bacterium]NRA18201.1 hypothetical protein [Oceanospirillaceae bacterium]